MERGPRLSGAVTTHIGTDAGGGRFADVEVVECAKCGRTWLRYSYEVEGLPRSGHWYAGIVDPAIVQSVEPADAPRVLAGLDWYLVGGSYFGGAITRTSGPLTGYGF